MTAPSIATLTAAIGAMTITRTSTIHGAQTLSILDLGETPTAIDERTCPVMFCDPEQTITNFETVRTGCGPATGDVHGYNYTLNYYAAIAPIGSGRDISEIMTELTGWASVITGAIADADDSLLAGNNVLADVSVIGTLTDPIGNTFHGLRLAVRVEEF